MHFLVSIVTIFMTSKHQGKKSKNRDGQKANHMVVGGSYYGDDAGFGLGHGLEGG